MTHTGRGQQKSKGHYIEFIELLQLALTVAVLISCYRYLRLHCVRQSTSHGAGMEWQDWGADRHLQFDNISTFQQHQSVTKGKGRTNNMKRSIPSVCCTQEPQTKNDKQPTSGWLNRQRKESKTTTTTKKGTTKKRRGIYALTNYMLWIWIYLF